MEGDDEASVARFLLQAAMKGWNTDPVSPLSTTTQAILWQPRHPLRWAISRREILHHADSFTPLSTAEQFRSTMPEGVLTGPFSGWQGFHMKSSAGWVHARNALASAFKEASRLGVTFITDSPQGRVTQLLYSNSDVMGAVTADGVAHRADRTILAAGAAAAQLFDFENQLRPTALTLAHIPLTTEESRLYKHLPVLVNIEQGFFMEPDQDRRELKICDKHPGYCNWAAASSASANSPFLQSVPVAKQQISVSAARRIRDLLRDTIPELADRPFSHARLCWCADTSNRAFLTAIRRTRPFCSPLGTLGTASSTCRPSEGLL